MNLSFSDRDKLGFYFDYKRYMLWTSHFADSESDIDFDEDDDDGSVKSWTQLAAGVSDDEY